MSYFKDEQELYEHLGSLFREATEDEALARDLTRANTVVQYRYGQPDATITVRMVDGETPRVDCGPTDLEPEVVMAMEADTAHRFWLGKVNPTVALARGQMKATGPVAKILKLVPLVAPLHPRYQARLEAAGRQDLLEVA